MILQFWHSMIRCWIRHQGIGSEGVEAEAVVGELLLEEPPAEVVHNFDGQGGVLAVEVALLHLLEHVGEHPVHHQG